MKRKAKTSFKIITVGILCVCLCGCVKMPAFQPTDTEASRYTEDAVSVPPSVSTEPDTEMFTDRDSRDSYDEKTAVHINGTGDTFTASLKSVEINGSTVTLSQEGTYILTGSVSDGQIIVDTDETAKVQLVLKGVDYSCKSSAPVYIKSADKVFITLEKDTVNTLKVTDTFIADGDINVDAAIFSKADLSFNGEGSLNLSSPKHGIVTKDDLVITAGEYNIESQSHGICGENSVRIKGGEIGITSGKDGIQSQHEDEQKGFVYLSGGVLNVNAGDDGINCTGSLTVQGGEYTLSVGDDALHAEKALVINDGKIDVSKSYEGIEGLTIDINGGDISVTASDDGLNSAGGNDQSGFGGMFGGGGNPFGNDPDCYIRITGGSVRIDAQGDGIDSNGSLYISGGECFVAGPTNGGNGALDYGGEGVMSGGVLVAAGASGMAQNMSSASTQCVVAVSLSGSGEITLADSSGKALLSFNPEKRYQHIVISHPELKVGEIYTVTADGVSEQITLTQTVTGGTGGFGGGPGGGGGGHRPRP